MSLTITYDGALSRLRLAATALGATATYAYVWRSTDNFTTFEVVRGGNRAVVAGGVLNIDDYEFEAGVPLSYQVTSYDVAGVQQASFSQSANQDLSAVWLKVPTAPYLNRPVVVQDKGPIGRRSKSGSFDVLNRSLPVGVGDVASSKAYTLYLLTTTAAEEEALDYLVASGAIIFVHLPHAVTLIPGGYWQMGNVDREPTLRLSPRRIWTMPLVEHAKPGVDVVGPAYTWASVMNDYATWADVLANNATWAVLLNRTASPSDVIVP